METLDKETSIIGLIRHLVRETSTLIKQEIALAKTELSEKVSAMEKHAVALAAGGVVAYAGLIVLLIGLGVLVSWGLAKTGLDPLVAVAIGVGGVGLLITLAGAVLVLSAIKSFSRESFRPEKTIQSLHLLKSRHEPNHADSVDAHFASSDEIRASVQVTEDMLSDTLGEIGQRLSPSHIKTEVGTRISERPYRFGAAAIGLGLISGLWVRSRWRRVG